MTMQVRSNARASSRSAIGHHGEMGASTNACHSHVTTDSNAEAWIYVPTGTCEKIVGARVIKVADPTPPAKKSALERRTGNPKFS